MSDPSPPPPPPPSPPSPSPPSPPSPLPPPPPPPSPSLSPLHPPLFHYPRYNFGHGHGYGYRWRPDWTWYNRPYYYVVKEDDKEDFNYTPIILVGGIAMIALIISLQKK